MKKLKAFLIMLLIIPFSLVFVACNKNNGGTSNDNGTDIETPVTPDEPDEPDEPVTPVEPTPSVPEVKYYSVDVDYNFPAKYASLKSNISQTLKTTETFTLPEIDSLYSDYFLGWFYDKTEEQVTSLVLSGTENQEIKIHANWNENNFTKYCQIGGILFETNDDEKTATVTGLSSEADLIVIPRFIERSGEEYRVNKIGDSAFANHKITKVLTYIEGVEIEDFAFQNTNLEEITFGSINAIGESAFENTKIKSVDFSMSLMSIEKSAFKNCTLLESVDLTKINQTVTEIKESTFEGCEKLSIIKLHEKFVAIGKNAFKNCKALQNVNFLTKSWLSSIGDHAFEGCTSLKSVSITENVTSIGIGMFDGCTGIEEFEISDLFYVIWASDCFEKFYGNLNSTLKKISLIGTKITKINESYFDGFTALETFVMCNSVTEIEDAFDGCVSLANITFSSNLDLGKFDVSVFEDTLWFKNGSQMIVSGTSIIYVPKSLSGNIEIDEGITNISASAFEGTSISTIKLPASIKTIGEKAFYNCSSLTKVEFLGTTSSLEKIEDKAFERCTSLCDVNLSNCTNLTAIGNRAFFNNATYNNFYIPASVETITGSIFGLSKIGSYSIVGDSSKYVCENGILFEIDNDQNKISVVAYPNAKSEYVLTLPETVNKIESYAFSKTSLKYIFTTTDLTNIEVQDYAFYNAVENSVKLLIEPKTNYDIISSNLVDYSSLMVGNFKPFYALEKDVDYTVSTDDENISFTLNLTDFPIEGSTFNCFVKFEYGGEVYSWILILEKTNVGTTEEPDYQIEIGFSLDISDYLN